MEWKGNEAKTEEESCWAITEGECVVGVLRHISLHCVGVWIPTGLPSIHLTVRLPISYIRKVNLFAPSGKWTACASGTVCANGTLLVGISCGLTRFEPCSTATCKVEFTSQLKICRCVWLWTVLSGWNRRVTSWRLIQERVSCSQTSSVLLLLWFV